MCTYILEIEVYASSSLLPEYDAVFHDTVFHVKKYTRHALRTKEGAMGGALYQHK